MREEGSEKSSEKWNFLLFHEEYFIYESIIHQKQMFLLGKREEKWCCFLVILYSFSVEKENQRNRGILCINELRAK